MPLYTDTKLKQFPFLGVTTHADEFLPRSRQTSDALFTQSDEQFAEEDMAYINQVIHEELHGACRRTARVRPKRRHTV